ncbi:Bug family tripartite tricarboxylate transporter substrate binding protein [Dankookia rubra]|nr:tripartite tricarboxylate transporter substrate-binding protein [Dankookia rubra]
MARLSQRALLAIAVSVLASPALAQGGATRPSTLVVAFPLGGSADTVTHVLTEGMWATLGQPVLLENRVGGNTFIAAEYVARARPNGHTLLMAAGTTLTISPVITSNLLNKVDNFAPVVLVSTDPQSPSEKKLNYLIRM